MKENGCFVYGYIGFESTELFVGSEQECRRYCHNMTTEEAQKYDVLTIEYYDNQEEEFSILWTFR